jgi:hypothetical protein
MVVMVLVEMVVVMVIVKVMVMVVMVVRKLFPMHSFCYRGLDSFFIPPLLHSTPQ